MAVVERGFAFGMTWCTSTSDGKDEIKAEAKRLKANVYIEVASDQSRMFGLVDLKNWKGVQSAAAAVADALSDGGIFIHQLNEKTAALIVIDSDRHLPVPDLDIVGPRSQVLDCAKKFLSTHPEYAPKIFGDVSANEIDSGSQPITTHPLSIDRIKSDALPTSELKPLSELGGRLLYLAMIFIVVITASFYEEICELVLPTPKAPAESLDAQYQKQVNVAITQIVQANQFPSNVMEGYMALLNEVASEAAGWRIESMKCVDVNCEAIWRRQPGATSEGFLKALNLKPNDPTLTFFEMDFVKRKLTFKKATVPRKLVIAPNATFSEIVGTWFQGLADRMQNLERPSIGELTPLVASNGAKLKDGEIPRAGDYRFTIPFSTSDLSAVSSLPDMMTIESIEVKREGEDRMVVKFNGKYYAF